MCRGWHRREERKQNGLLEGWRQTRLLATLWVNTHRGENDPVLAPEQFLPLPGDTLPEQLLLTEEEVEVVFTRSTALDADLK